MGQVTSSEPSVAWRTIALPDGSLAMLHQRAQASGVQARPGGYSPGTKCRIGVVHSTVTVLNPGAHPATSAPLSGVVLPVDLAVTAGGIKVAIAVAGAGDQGPGLVVAS